MQYYDRIYGRSKQQIDLHDNREDKEISAMTDEQLIEALRAEEKADAAKKAGRDVGTKTT